MSEPEHEGGPGFQAVQTRARAILDQAQARQRDAIRLLAIMTPDATVLDGGTVTFAGWLDRLTPELRAEVDAIMKRISAPGR
jgi:hypothetical protein